MSHICGWSLRFLTNEATSGSDEWLAASASDAFTHTHQSGGKVSAPSWIGNSIASFALEPLEQVVCIVDLIAQSPSLIATKLRTL